MKTTGHRTITEHSKTTGHRTMTKQRTITEQEATAVTDEVERKQTMHRSHVAF